MSRNHLVMPGESILSLAKLHGYHWKNLWMHPDNAALRQRRQNPNVLLSGDVVVIPDKQVREETRPTGARHRFVRKGEPACLRLQLKRLGRPRQNEPYELVLRSRHGELRKSGQTDGEGRLCEPVPADAHQALLLLCGGSEILELAIGHLDPADDLAGIQQRLCNLGFSCSDPEGELGAETRAALRSFQGREGLPISGNPDGPTVQRLLQFHP